MRNGDYAAAAAVYAGLVSASDQQIAQQAQLGLATAALRDGDYANATDAFHGFLASYPESDLTPDAHFLLAETLSALGEPLQAVSEYRLYLASRDAITAYVDDWIGDALYAAGEFDSATASYETAIAAAPLLSVELNTREKLALVHVAREDYDASLAQYDAILDRATIAAYRARIEHQAAETLLLASETEDGYNRHLRVVETYPTEYYAYLSLVVLVEAGLPPDDFLRGQVDYCAGAYGPAVEALYRYIETYPDTHSGDAHYFIGMSFLRAGSPELATGEFDTLIETHPDNRYVGDGWMGKAAALADQGKTDEAIETYRAFADAVPDHPRAPEALWRAARLLESEGEVENAAQAFMDVHIQFPNSDYGATALFRSGLQSYRLGELTDAAAAWDTLVEIYPDSSYHPAAHLWLGKVHVVRGDSEGAQAAFGAATSSDPTGYYGLRAADLVRDPLAPIYGPTTYVPSEARLGDEAAEQAEAESWLAGWLALGNATGLAQLDPTLAADPRLQRGLELWRLGHYAEAQGELEAVRQGTAAGALAQYQLALLFRDIGLYRSSILCARQIVALSPAETALDAPVFIGRLSYPTPYEGLILDNAVRSGLDPLLVFATIRQESLFEGFVTSYAGARGLMQVIPATGDLIAVDLGWPPDYESDDLYLPFVSVRFGTHYLALQRDRFDGRSDVALAAYNGGPGNAQVWLENAGDDADLFLELITFSETQTYIWRIKEHMTIYQALYGQ
jgi:soluble lytic murein transglycosylase